eukprot:scaffold325089_cov58-Tisochrysis_lutea.AAC.1
MRPWRGLGLGGKSVEAMRPSGPADTTLAVGVVWRQRTCVAVERKGTIGSRKRRRRSPQGSEPWTPGGRQQKLAGLVRA